MIFALFPLLILAGIVALIVRLVSNRDDRDDDAGGTSVRRFFQYSLLLSVLIIVAVGLSDLLAELIPGEDVLRAGTDRPARSVAYLIIGGPVLYGLVRWIRSDADADDRRSLSWALYVSIASFVALTTAAVGLFQVAEAIVGVDTFRPASLARFLVWGAVWVIHFRIAESHEHAGRLRVHVLGGSLIGLVAIAVAVGSILNSFLSSIYEQISDTTLVAGGGDDLKRAVIGLVIGGAVWFRYWYLTYGRMGRDGLWQTYVLMAGVLAGLVTMLVGLTVTLFSAIDWFFGGASGSAARHFDGVPGTLATLGVGWAIWSYHRSILHADRPTARSEADRVYEYLVAAVGLFAAAAGLATVLVAVIESLVPGGLAARDAGETSTLMAAIAVLIVGIPVWWRTWRQIQRLRIAQPAIELSSPTRRIYLFALFGLGGVTALISLLSLTVTALEDLFDSRFGSETIYSVRVQIALVITVGAIAAYHWSIRKEDQQDAPAVDDLPERPVRAIVLVSANGRELADDVTKLTGVRVRVWDRPGSEEVASLDDIVGAIEQGTHPRLLIVARADGLEVIPYTERG